MNLPSRLYHLAEESNIASIFAHGLMSTERLLELVRMPKPKRSAFLRSHRTDCVALGPEILIRDQRPMPPGALAPALEPPMEPADWYALLNGFVFFWPNRERLDRLQGAYAHRPQVVLTFDSAALLRDFGAVAYVSPINSGNARRRAAKRGPATLVHYDAWARSGWPDRRGVPIAEVLFNATIPVTSPYLIDIERRATGANR